MKKLVAAITLTAMLVGCSHMHRCDPTAPGTCLDEVNRAVDRKSVRLRLQDGTKVYATSVTVGADSTFLMPVRPPAWVEAPERPIGGALHTSEIKTLTVTEPTGGSGKKALLGLAIGAVLGFISGVHYVESGAADDDWGTGRPSSGAYGVVWGIGLGLVGCLVGYVWGASSSEHVYDLTGE